MGGSIRLKPGFAEGETLKDPLPRFFLRAGERNRRDKGRGLVRLLVFILRRERLPFDLLEELGVVNRYGRQPRQRG